ncbi:MAG: NADH-quinone oxidoreductase subunit J, partial [Opitutaceae bacterium]
LVYVGAISMVALFAVLLTRPSRDENPVSPVSARRLLPALIAGGAVLGILVGAVLGSPLRTAAQPPSAVTVKELGLHLMGPHAAALVVVGALLTVALLGAVVIAATGRPGEREETR